MAHEDVGSLGGDETELSASRLLQSLLESVLDRTLSHLENHPNVYSISDLHILHTLSSQINQRIELIQNRFQYPEDLKSAQVQIHSQSLSNSTIREKSVSETYPSENENRSIDIDWNAKDEYVTKAQHEYISFEVSFSMRRRYSQKGRWKDYSAFESYYLFIIYGRQQSLKSKKKSGFNLFDEISPRYSQSIEN